MSANGVDLYYEVSGSGPPLLFISGTGGDLRTRPNVFDGPVPGHFEVLAFDQRGLGQSGAPRATYTMADYADDAAALLGAIGWRPVRVMGVSFGGMVAQELVVRHPGLVDRLVLGCTSSGGDGGASYPLHELETLPPRERAERWVELSDTRLDEAWRQARPDAWEAVVDMAMSARRDDVDTDGAARQLVARRGHDTFSRLHEIEVPVLLAGGRFDGIAPPDNLRAMASRIPGAELRFYEGGHLFLLQDGAAFAEIIGWLAD